MTTNPLRGPRVATRTVSIFGVVALIGTAVGIGQAQAQIQSLDQAIGLATANNCANLGGAAGNYGPGLARICAVPGFGGVTGSSGGNTSSESDVGGEDQESKVKNRLEGLRDKEPTPSSASDMTFSIGQLSGFASFDYQNVDKRTTILTPGFTSDRYGGTVGVDHSFGKLVLGVAANYSNDSGSFRNTGGNFSTDSYGGYVYGSILPVDNLFFDAVVGYAHKDMSLNRNVFLANTNVTTTGVASSNTSGDEVRFGLSGGYDFYYQNITYGPRAGVNFSHNSVDAFSEHGTTGLELAYGDQEFDSLTSSVGGRVSMAISTSFGVIVPQASADYIHEFDDNQQTFTVHLVQDLKGAQTPLTYSTDKPGRDYAGLGLGVVMVLPHGISPYLNYRALVGNSLKTTQTVSAGLRVEF